VRLLLALAFATVAVLAGVGAVSAEAEDAPAEVTGTGSPATPVLSARRVPALLAAPVADRALQAELTDLVARQRGATCLTVSSAGRTVFSDDPDLPLVPASLQKVVTAVAALEVLGPDFRFRTAVVAAAAPVDGIVMGDAWLVGGGDPILSTAAYVSRFEHQPQTATLLEPLADAMAGAGIRGVQGSLLGDESRYDADRYPDSWPERYVNQDQSGPLSALSVNDAYVAFPPLPDVETPDEEPAPDPPAHAAAVLAGLLSPRGVQVAATGSGTAPEGAVELAAIESPPLTDVVAQLLRDSDNQTGELLLKEMAVARGRPGTTADGLAVVDEVLADLGLPIAGSDVTDGSGLDLGNRLSCSLVMAMLDRAGPDSALGRGLAVAGQTGTLTERFVGVPATGRLIAKTGTLPRVTSLGGFVRTVPGSTLTFSFIVNLDGGAEVDDADLRLQDELGDALVRYPEGPPLESLAPLPAGSG
jgi:D-alanyl-D-alanine carboxypeptidase/D-alanyl-D-alanine-endopeptidase (penicillin-binding protein 4)